LKITLSNIGKKFNRQWIFRDIDWVFEPRETTALVGNNGSGKSTLLQLIYNYQTYSKGSISYELNGAILSEEHLVGKVSFAAPYLELLEDFSLMEMLHFHFKLVSVQPEITFAHMIAACGLSEQEDKPIKYFSSGMKQRLKLIIAIYADTPLLLLDEPCSNLDEQGILWYRNLMQTQLGKRSIIIASNQLFEYDFCDKQLPLVDFKKKPIA